MTHIAFYGGSFNPPTIAHETIVDHLIKQTIFDRVIVKPCGTRQDKPELLQTLDSRRIKVTEKLSRNNSHYHLDLRAMEKPMVPTIEEWQNLRSQNSNSTIYFVTGTDLFIEESDGLCQIEKWIEGITLFSEAYFYIFPRFPLLC